jgi:hypothetical protein
VGLIYDGSHGGTTTPVAGAAGPTGKEDEASSLDLEKCITFGPLNVGPVRTARAGKKETFPSHFYVAGAAAAGRKDNCCVYGTNHGEQKRHNPLTEKTSRNSHVLTTERASSTCSFGRWLMAGADLL